MKNTLKELDIISEGWLDEHKEEMISSGEAKKQRDFIDMMISMHKDSETSNHDSDTDTLIKTIKF